MAVVVVKGLDFDDRILCVGFFVYVARLFVNCFCKAVEARMYVLQIMFLK